MQRNKSNEAKVIRKIIKQLTGIETSNGTYYTKKELKKGLRMIHDQVVINMVSKDIMDEVDQQINSAFDEMMFGVDNSLDKAFDDITAKDNSEEEEGIFINGKKIAELSELDIPISGEDKIKEIDSNKDYSQSFDINFNTGTLKGSRKCPECKGEFIVNRGSGNWCKDCGYVWIG